MELVWDGLEENGRPTRTGRCSLRGFMIFGVLGPWAAAAARPSEAPGDRGATAPCVASERAQGGTEQCPP